MIERLATIGSSAFAPSPKNDLKMVDKHAASSKESLALDTLSLPVLPRQRRRSDRPSTTSALRPAFTPAERSSFDITSVPIFASTGIERDAHDVEKLAKTSETASITPSASAAVSLRIQSDDDRSEVGAVPSRAQRRTRRAQFAAVCLCFFISGWNDGSTGPLIPTIQRYYHVCALAAGRRCEY
jgi:hypothetical protein